MDQPQGRRRRPPALLTILLIAIAIVVIILIVRHDAGTVFGMSTTDFSRFAMLLAILAFVGVGVIVRSMRASEVLQAMLFWTTAIVVLVGLYGFRDELGIVGGRIVGALVPGTPIAGRLSGESDPDSVVVLRNNGGHFGVRAEIEDEPMSLLVDTGATFVTLTPQDAADIGIDPATLDYVVPIQTANGTIRAASVRLGRVAIGPIERQDVPALVAPRGALEESLLGLSFLDRLGGYSISGDRLVLHP
jgi:aspartyl protease family protein